jgi:hypothetical protein
VSAPARSHPGTDVRRSARAEGLAASLTVLYTAVLPDLLPFGPGGHAVCPVPLAGAATGSWSGGVEAPRDPARERVLRTVRPAGGDLLLVKGGPAVGGGEDGRTRRFRSGLLWLRLGLSEALLDACLTHLGGRRTGATATLIQQQMVKGAVADAVMLQQEALAVLEAAADGESADHTHALLTAADRELIRLLGASGYVAGSPGETADLSELLADVYHGAVAPC